MVLIAQREHTIVYLLSWTQATFLATQYSIGCGMSPELNFNLGIYHVLLSIQNEHVNLASLYNSVERPFSISMILICYKQVDT